MQFSSIKIRNFRSLTQANLFKLKRLNFLAGINGSGKSSILEAIFLLCGGANARLPLVLDGLRTEQRSRIVSEWALASLFPNLIAEDRITIEGQRQSTKARKPILRQLTITPIRKQHSQSSSSSSTSIITGLKLYLGEGKKSTFKASWEWVSDGPVGRAPNAPDAQSKSPIAIQGQTNNPIISAKYVTPAANGGAETYDGLVDLLKARRISKLVNILNIIEADIRDIVPIEQHGLKQILVDKGEEKKLQPLTVLGAGFNKLLEIAIGFEVAENGVIIIDEIENGFHYSFYEKILDLIYNASIQRNTQVFISTHSSEFLTHLARWSKSKELASEIAYFRLWRKKDGTRGEERLTGEDVVDIEEIGGELR